MNSQTILLTGKTQSLSWGNKIIVGLIASVLVVAGFFASLFIFAALSLVVLAVGAKLWWSFRCVQHRMQAKTANHQTASMRHSSTTTAGQVIEGEYHVKQDI